MILVIIQESILWVVQSLARLLFERLLQFILVLTPDKQVFLFLIELFLLLLQISSETLLFVNEFPNADLTIILMDCVETFLSFSIEVVMLSISHFRS